MYSSTIFDTFLSTSSSVYSFFTFSATLAVVVSSVVRVILESLDSLISDESLALFWLVDSICLTWFIFLLSFEYCFVGLPGILPRLVSADDISLLGINSDVRVCCVGGYWLGTAAATAGWTFLLKLGPRGPKTTSPLLLIAVVFLTLAIVVPILCLLLSRLAVGRTVCCCSPWYPPPRPPPEAPPPRPPPWPPPYCERLLAWSCWVKLAISCSLTLLSSSISRWISTIVFAAFSRRRGTQPLPLNSVTSKIIKRILDDILAAGFFVRPIILSNFSKCSFISLAAFCLSISFPIVVNNLHKHSKFSSSLSCLSNLFIQSCMIPSVNIPNLNNSPINLIFPNDRLLAFDNFSSNSSCFSFRFNSSFSSSIA